MQQIGGMPPTAGNGGEQVVLAFVQHNGRGRPPSGRRCFRSSFEFVAVVEVNGIAVGFLLGELGGKGGDGEEEEVFSA